MTLQASWRPLRLPLSVVRSGTQVRNNNRVQSYIHTSLQHGVSRTTGYIQFALHPDPRIVDVAAVARYSVVSSANEHSLTLQLVDGTEITDVDEVWVGTGYGWSLPFVRVLGEASHEGSNENNGNNSRKRALTPLTPASLNLTRIPSLHRFILYAPNPTLALIGQVMCFTPFITADVTSTWLTLAWQGEIPYPLSVEDRLVSERAKLAWVEEQRRGVDHPSSFLHYHVLAASELYKEHFPAAGTSLWDALQTGQDRHRDPEPDLEAEP